MLKVIRNAKTRKSLSVLKLLSSVKSAMKRGGAGTPGPSHGPNGQKTVRSPYAFNHQFFNHLIRRRSRAIVLGTLVSVLFRYLRSWTLLLLWWLSLVSLVSLV